MTPDIIELWKASA